MTDWQPIETAPKDGSWIAVWRQYASRMRMVQWDAIYDAWKDDDGNHLYHVTHWMPLPAPPKGEGS